MTLQLQDNPTTKPAADAQAHANAPSEAGAAATGSAMATKAALGGGDLAEIIEAYNQVTEKLQHSHETLQGEVTRLRQELATKDAQLQRSRRLSALGEMAAGIAHEIRNPLAAIQLYASMASDDLADIETAHGQSDPLESADDSTRKIASAVQGLSAIVNDVLSFAKQSAPEPRELAVADVFRKAVEAHRPAIDQAGVAIDLPTDDTLTVQADPDQLNQALLNLIRNSVDAMAETDSDLETASRDDTHPQPRLTLSVNTSRDGVTLTLADTGPGIDADAVDRIFNPFFTTRSTGTGLGLAIVHRIVDAHGGAIAVHNQTTGGATFELTFPADPTAGAPSEQPEIAAETNL